MFIKFIKAHNAGIAEGAVKKVEVGHGRRLIAEGYAEEHTPEAIKEAPEPAENEPKTTAKKKK